MKIGVSAFAWTTEFGPSHLDIIGKVKEHGIDGFEIPMFDPAKLAARDIRHAAELNDLEFTVCAILPKNLSPISSDRAIRREAYEHLLRCIETTREIGATLLGGPLLAPIGFLPGRRRTSDEWKWAVETFQKLGVALDTQNVTLSLEPVNRSETFFIRTAAEAKLFCEAVGHPRIGITIDTFHANIEEKNTAEAMHSLGQHLKHVHASENDRGLLGSGHVDFPAIVSVLREIHYEGYLMIEGFGYSQDKMNVLGALWANPDVTPEDIAFGGAAYLRGLLNSSQTDR
jgi:D-psicose/D-tagatose/L-ribulose 3-epimerase